MTTNLVCRWLWDIPTSIARYWKHFGSAQLLVKLQKEYRRRTVATPKPLRRRHAWQWGREFSRRPRISLVVPVYRTRLPWLKACVNSVRSQYYPSWELILVDDNSQLPRLTHRLQSYARRDSRIRVISLSKNAGIAGATNIGIEAAAGELIGFLDHDDELTPDALTWIAAAHNRLPQARVVLFGRGQNHRKGQTLRPVFQARLLPGISAGEHVHLPFQRVRGRFAPAGSRPPIGF